MKINKIESGRYLILDEIGKGGNSRVYRAKDINTGKILALKKYHTHDVFNRQRLMADVERELNILKYREHPALPKVFNILCENNEFYLVMELVEGKTLKELMKQKRKPSAKEVVHIVKQLLSVMYYLHSLEPPIIYRDVKPENIIVQNNGQIKLIDFGNAKKFNRDVSADIRAMGTPKFAAPEQYGDSEGKGIYNTDIRTDIYGVGAIMYYLATGLSIKEKGSFVRKVLYRIRFGGRYNKIVKRATKLYPKDRFANDIEMLVEVYRLRN